MTIRCIWMALGIAALLVWLTMDQHDLALLLGSVSMILSGLQRPHERGPWSNHPSIRS